MRGRRFGFGVLFGRQYQSPRSDVATVPAMLRGFGVQAGESAALSLGHVSPFRSRARKGPAPNRPEHPEESAVAGTRQHRL